MKTVKDQICSECQGAGEVWTSAEEDKTEINPCCRCGGRGFGRLDQRAPKIDHRIVMKKTIAALEKYLKEKRK